MENFKKEEIERLKQQLEELNLNKSTGTMRLYSILKGILDLLEIKEERR